MGSFNSWATINELKPPYHLTRFPPIIEGDTENWWSLRYSMTKDEMNKINDKTNELDVRIAPPT